MTKYVRITARNSQQPQSTLHNTAGKQARMGVTDLYIPWGINVDHARTAYHKTCGTEYQQPYRRFDSQTPYYKWNVAQARPMSVSEISRSLQSWVSTTHRSYSQLTFLIFLWKQHGVHVTDRNNAQPPKHGIIKRTIGGWPARSWPPPLPRRYRCCVLFCYYCCWASVCCCCCQ